LRSFLQALGQSECCNFARTGFMQTALTPQQILAMAYARLSGLRNNLGIAEPHELDQLCSAFNRALDDLHAAGFDLSAFKLDGGEEPVTDLSGWLRARLDAVLDYMDLFAGLP
jgi:hypothetical protein